MTSNSLNELQAVQLAIAIEERGWAFYKEAAALTQDEEQKALFLHLQSEEYVHKNTFIALLDEHTEKGTNVVNFSAKSKNYLDVLLETHVFPLPEEIPAVLKQLPTLDAILKIALDAEKNLVLFYDELATAAQLPDTKQVFAKLKQEEQEHVVRIQEMIRGYA